MNTLLILPIVLAVIAWILLRRPGIGGGTSSARPQWVPDPANEASVSVRGWERGELDRIIADFRTDYADDGYPAYSIAVTTTADGLQHELSFPEDIHPLLFVYLVNFLHYPFEDGLSGRTVQVVGRSSVTDVLVGVGPELYGGRAILYVPTKDDGHDTVVLEVESGEIFALSLSESRWRKTVDVRRPAYIAEMM